MKSYISNEIVIEEPTKELLDWAKSNLVLDNPEYKQMKLLGKENIIKWKHIPEQLDLYAMKRGRLVLPFGVLRCIWDKLKQGEIVTDFNSLDPISIANDEPTYPLYDYQEPAVKEIVFRKGGVLVANCGSGKGLPLNAKIYTPNGWKYNGELEVGDEIIGSNGKPIKVTHIFDRGLVEAYKVKFSDGTETVCDKDHLWAVQTCNQRNEKSKEYFTISTEEIYKMNLKNRPRMQNGLFIPVVEPVEFTKKEVPIDPWLFGLLISDGCFQKYNISVSIPEKDIVEKVSNIVNITLQGRSNNYDYNIRDNAKTYHNIVSLGLDCKHSYEKFIPDVYKYNDINTRLKLLQGILDGDGSVKESQIEYTTTSEQLAKDICEIVQSLGGTTKIVERYTKFTYNGEVKQGRKSYRVRIKLYKFVPFTSKKHLSRTANRTKYLTAYRKIIDVEKIDSIISRCIKVDAKDELYVTDNFVVTHNTTMGIEIIKRIGKKALWLVHTSDLLRQAQKDFLTLYPNTKIGLTTNGKLEIGEDVTISTVQTMSKIDPELYKDEFEVVICDESAHVCSSPTQMKMFGIVLSHIKARYKIGLTATPARADGMIKAMYAYIGVDSNGAFGPMYKIDRSKVKTMPSQHIKFDLYNGYENRLFEFCDTSGMIIYNNLISALSEDYDRTKTVVENIVKYAKEGRKQVALTLRVGHCEQIVEMLNKRGIKAVLCVGSVNAKQRSKILNQEIEWDVLVSTYALLKEGVSIKELDTLHLVTPVKDKGMVVQCAGRIERYLEGKKTPLVLDYVDMDIPYCVKAYDKRRRALKTRF